MEVFDGESQRLALGHGENHGDEELEGPLLANLGGKLEGLVAAIQGNRKERRHQGDVLRRIEPEVFENLFDLLEPRSRGVVGSDLEQLEEQGEDRKEGAVAVVGGAGAEQPA